MKTPIAFTDHLTAGQMDTLLADGWPLEITRGGTAIDDCQVGQLIEVQCTEDDRKVHARIISKNRARDFWWDLELRPNLSAEET